MNSCLILLTNYYPFHKGEEYLESEIDYLSTKFNRIFVVSTMVSNNMRQTRRVPKNVVVLPVGISHSLGGKAKMTIKQFKPIFMDSEKRQMVNNDSKGKILNKLYCYYFESRSMDIYERVQELLNKHDFEDYDRITIYSYWLYVTARVAVELKNRYFNRTKTYVISRAHRYDLYENEAPLKYLPQRDYLLKNLDEIYPCSQDGVDSLNENYLKYKKKINVARLGTAYTGVQCDTKRDKLYIVSCSAVRKVKRLDSLIDVLVELEERNIPYLWTHIGDGPDFQKIINLAAKKLNMKNVCFTGFIKNQEVLKWYKENPVTVFVNLSTSEGVPVSIMEAISMGLPVIATDVGGTREILDSGINGYLLKRNFSTSEVVEALTKVLVLSNEEYNEMCKNALNIWNERSNADLLYSHFADQMIGGLNK